MATQEELLAQLRALMQPQGQPQPGAQPVAPAQPMQSQDELLAQLKEVTQNPVDWENLPEVGGAPELNDLTAARSYWTALGLMMSGDNEAASKIVKEHIPEAEIIGRDGKTAIKLPSGTYIANRPGLSWQDASSGIFQLLSYLPAGKIFGTSVKQLGKGAAASGATAGLQEGGLEALGADREAGDIATSVGLSAAMAPVSQLAAKPIGNLAGRIFKGSPTPQAKAVLESGEEFGVPVMTSDVLPPDTFAKRIGQKIGERIPFVGTGPLRTAQFEAREKAVQQIANKFGADTDENLLSNIVKDLKAKSAQKMERAAILRNTANTSLDQFGNVPMSKTSQAIKEAVEKEQTFGARADQGVIEDLMNLAEAPAGNMTFTTELRSRLGEEIAGLYKGENQTIGSRFAPYYQRIKNAMTEDMKQFAKTSGDEKAFKDWQKANKLFGDEYENVKKSALKKVFDKGDIEPETINTLLREAVPSKTKALFKALTPKGRKNARSYLIADFLKKSDGSPTRFTNYLKKNSNVIDELFKGEDARTLVGFKKLMDATKRGSEAGVSTSTGQEAAAMGGLATGIYAPLPALAAGAGIGALARAYESKPIRGLLLRLANTPKTNKDYDKIIQRINSLLLPVLQTEVQ